MVVPACTTCGAKVLLNLSFVKYYPYVHYSLIQVYRSGGPCKCTRNKKPQGILQDVLNWSAVGFPMDNAATPFTFTLNAAAATTLCASPDKAQEFIRVWKQQNNEDDPVVFDFDTIILATTKALPSIFLADFFITSMGCWVWKLNYLIELPDDDEESEEDD
jgi:hypothetical protein